MPMIARRCLAQKSGTPARRPAGGKTANGSRHGFERVALLLQGGGALGSYQGGVYEALAEADLHPDYVAGVSIGAINAALIAGNAPEDRVKALRTFWEKITTPPPGLPSLFASMVGAMGDEGDARHEFLNRTRAFATLTGGAPGFFVPRLFSPALRQDLSPDVASYYDISPLRETLLDLVDFDRLNAGEVRYCAGAVNIAKGNFESFDSALRPVTVDHVMASGALPPGFPAIRIGEDYYWDGGLISNTPLHWVLSTHPRLDTLAFQVDLWSATGKLPTSMTEIDQREKDIRFSSRTRAFTEQFQSIQHARHALHRLLDLLPDRSLIDKDPELKALALAADNKVYNIVHLIYRTQSYEATTKDYEFSRSTMEDHWASGRGDCQHSLGHPEIFERPTSPTGVGIFDLTRQETHP